MPYENPPTENAPALPIRADEWTFKFSLDAATIDDLDLFSAENSTSNKQMLDFLDRVVTDVAVQGESQGAGVRGKGGGRHEQEQGKTHGHGHNAKGVKRC